ncbi:leucine-rich repeat domain-containing protein [bacterium]|nr:leucine-rich repeat domain-containing protein [bacterium]
MGDFSFVGCSNITNITIPDSVTSIGRQSFYKCSTLRNIKIPHSVTRIGESAFTKCTNLTTINFFGDAPKIHDNAFEESSPTIYRKPDAKGWGDTFAGRPVKLITEKP